MKNLFYFLLILATSCTAPKQVSITLIKNNIANKTSAANNTMTLHIRPTNERGVKLYTLERKYFSKWTTIGSFAPIGAGAFDYQVNYSATGTYRLRVNADSTEYSKTIIVK